MPTIATSLATDLLGISWALLSYQLSNIGLSIVFGRLSDLRGREKVFALGFLVFSAGSLLCGFSQSLIQLIVFRFLQGIGGAMLQSSSRALAAESVPENLAGRAQGYMTTAHHVGFIIGPSIGGLMIDYLSWRWSFFFLVPIGICGMLDVAECKAASTGFPKPLSFHRLSRRRIVIRDNQRVGDAARPAHTADDSNKLQGCVGGFVYRLPCRLDSS